MMITVKMPLWQKILGWVMLAMHLVFLPAIIVLVSELLGFEMDNFSLNIVNFVAAFLLVNGIFHRFLLKNMKTFGRSPKKTFLSILVSFAIYFALNIVVTTMISLLAPDFSNVNDESIDAIAEFHYWPMFICTVFLVPVTEELIYRGVLFQIPYHKNRILAYVLASLIFAAIHVVGYIGTTDLYTLFLAFHQYLPASIALAFAYEMTDSIWAPIIIHSTINMLAMLSMG